MKWISQSTLIVCRNKLKIKKPFKIKGYKLELLLGLEMENDREAGSNPAVPTILNLVKFNRILNNFSLS